MILAMMMSLLEIKADQTIGNVCVYRFQQCVGCCRIFKKSGRQQITHTLFTMLLFASHI